MIDKIEAGTAKICVVGLGYVGLPTAVILAEKGFRVTGADVDEKKVGLLEKSISPLKDLGLDDRLEKVMKDGHFSATSDVTLAASKSDVILIIVPTPVTETKNPDLSSVTSACKAIRKGLRKGQLIVLESSTYPGTTEEIVIPILEESGLKAGDDFGVAHCPERYNPGDPKHTLERISRIVGGITPE
ncbi:MAG: nucleotide sugar dehydrogenase, partial [Thermoplasmata archaeon]|nr:nucleotide sugar dehydrogenase [Thermoplasmata archaeon]